MPPRGVKPGSKRARQYEHVKESALDQGRGEDRATQDKSSGQRGGQRSGTNRPKGRTRDQLYNEARQMGIAGRSSMSKAQLQRAVDGRKS
jgi:hypothetical protein